MVENKDTPQAGQEGSEAQHTLPISILRQYVRDLSFENPTAPESFKLSSVPDMEIEIDVKARKVEAEDTPNLFEVVLRIRVITTEEGSPIFIAELDYGTLLTIGDEVPEEQHHPVLFIEVPRFAYPYASQIITNMCVQGGFPQVFLKPIDFHSMYMARHKEEIAAAQKETETAS